LPKMPNGKVDRRALPEPEGIRPELEAVYAPPRNEMEQAIAAIWQEALRVENVGVDDNFFDLGGHSLLLISIHGKLCSMLKREFSIIEMFNYPTIDSLAKYLSQSKVEQSPSRQEEGMVERLTEGKRRLKQLVKQELRKAKTR